MRGYVRKSLKTHLTLEDLAKYGSHLVIIGRSGRIMHRPEKDRFMRIREVQTAVEIFFDRPVTRTQLRSWARREPRIGPEIHHILMPDDEVYEFYVTKEVADWLVMTMKCREHRAFGRSEQAAVLETRHGYGAIPNNFRAAPNPNLYNLDHPETLPKRVVRHLAATRKRQENVERLKRDGTFERIRAINTETRRLDRQAKADLPMRQYARNKARRERTDG
jgi:hypothetical protein